MKRGVHVRVLVPTEVERLGDPIDGRTEPPPGPKRRGAH